MTYDDELKFYKKHLDKITAELDINLLLDLVDYNADAMKFIKPQNMQIIQSAYERNPSIFKHIDFSKVNTQFLEKVVNDNPLMIQYIYYPSTDLIKLALIKDINVLPYIEKYIDDEIYYWLLPQNGMVLEFIPVERQTEAMVLLAIKENIEAYQYANIKTKNTDLYIVEKDPTKIKWISNYWPEITIPLIKYNPQLITQFYNMPELITDEVIKLAISLQPEIYKTLPTPSKEIMKFALLYDINLLSVMPYSQELINYAISINGLALKYVKKKDLRTIKYAISNNVLSLDYVQYKRQFLIDYAFKKDGIAIKYITNPTLEQCLDAIYRNPKAIQFIPLFLQNKEIQSRAISSGGTDVIPFIKPINNEIIIQMLDIEPGYIFKLEKPTTAMYIASFRKEGSLIRFFRNWDTMFNNEIISAALENDGTVFEFLKNKTKKLALIAIKQFPAAIKWTSGFQDLEIAKLAVSLDSRTLFFVDKKLLNGDLLKLAISIDPHIFSRTEGELSWEQWLTIIGKK